MDDAAIKNMVDKYVRWDKLITEAKREIERLKADFQKLAVETLKDKKVKQVEFWGNGNRKVVVQTSETLKLVSYHFLLQVLGEVLLKDFVKIEPQYKLSEPFKRVLAAVFQGSYVEQSVDEVLVQITADDKVQKALKKKLKGKWDKDVESLKVLAGLSNDDAEHFAYFIQEAINYEKIVHLLEAAGHKLNSEEFSASMAAIRHAVVVEEGIKVGVESEGIA